MALQSNNGEGGTNGVAVTTANSGGASGTPWDAVSIAGGGAVGYQNSTVAHGAMAYGFSLAGTGTAFVTWNVASASVIAVRAYLNLDGQVPNLVYRAVDIRNSTGTILRLQIDTTGDHWQVQEGGTGTPVTYNSPSITAGGQPGSSGWYRWEAQISALGAGSGSYNAQLYAYDSAVPIGGVTSTTGQLGTASIAAVRFGPDNSPNYVGNIVGDDFAINPGSSTPIGPVAPVANSAGWTINGIPW